MQGRSSFGARASRWALGLGMLGLATGTPQGALALSLADTAPLFFGAADGNVFTMDGEFGFAADAVGLPDVIVPQDIPQITAAGFYPGEPLPDADLLLETLIDFDVIHQDPMSPGPSYPDDPFIADSTWRVFNNTDRVLRDTLLVFTTVDPFSAYPGPGLDDFPIALDGNLLEILRVDRVGEDPYFFGFLRVPELGPGEDALLPNPLRYIVFGDLPEMDFVVGDEIVTRRFTPVLGLTGVVIPEPQTSALVALGLVALAASRRRWDRA